MPCGIPFHSQASDDNGIGQTSVISLRISLLDANDSPPVCESPLYRASLDEGASTFDPPLIIRARDPDAISQMSYRYPLPPFPPIHIRLTPFNLQISRILSIGSPTTARNDVSNLFSIDKQTGQLYIRDASALDVNHLKAENIFFAVEVRCGRSI